MSKWMYYWFGSLAGIAEGAVIFSTDLGFVPALLTNVGIVMLIFAVVKGIELLQGGK